MKKAFIIFACLSVYLVVSLSAAELSFEVLPSTPLFEEIKLDPYAMNTSISYMKFIDPNEGPTKIRGVKYSKPNGQDGEYVDVPFAKKPSNSYLRMKMA